MYGAGGQKRVPERFIKEFLTPLPPTSEQQAIVSFLAEKTVTIDALIAKKEELLNRLVEKRTALITQAVTKGLNPDAPMKPSGVEWLGEIPEHWRSTALKRSLSTPITDGPHETPEILLEGVPFISAEAVKNDKLDFDKKRGYISQEDYERYCWKYKPMLFDIYMVKSGATTGNVAMVETEEEFSIWSPLAAIRANQHLILPRFLFYFIKSKAFRHGVELYWAYGTQQNIGMGIIGSLPILIPRLDEQKKIIQFLDNQLSIIDEVTTKIQQAIDQLIEYRKSLITAAVTGQIKVF